jgi:hypothetical protein
VREIATGWPSCVVLMCALGLAGAAWAEDAHVQIHADVVLMSNQGNDVDPSLVIMKDTFTREGFSFHSFKRLSSQKVALSSQKATELALPNHKKAMLRVDSVHRGGANVSVKVGAVNTTYTLGQEGSVFINFGHQNGGELVLVLSPIGAKHPRRALESARPFKGFWHLPAIYGW